MKRAYPYEEDEGLTGVAALNLLRPITPLVEDELDDTEYRVDEEEEEESDGGEELVDHTPWNPDRHPLEYYVEKLFAGTLTITEDTVLILGFHHHRFVVDDTQHVKLCNMLSNEEKLDNVTAGRLHWLYGFILYLDYIDMQPYDPSRILAHINRAYELGEPRAIYFLALSNLQGEMLPRDVTEGLRLMRKAADQGYWAAAVVYGNYHKSGRYNVLVDCQKTAYYYSIAAAQNHPAALYIMSQLHRHGDGVPCSLEDEGRYLAQYLNTRDRLYIRISMRADARLAELSEQGALANLAFWGCYSFQMPSEQMVWFPERTRYAIITTLLTMKRLRMPFYVSNLITFYVATRNGW